MTTLSAEESLLISACRPIVADADRSNIARFAAKIDDWPRVIWRAEQYRTLPLLFAHLEASGGLSQAPAAVGTYLRNWVALSRVRSLAQFQQLARVVRGLQEEHIDYFLLKGSGLALYYPDPLSRPMQDLDFIVRPDDAMRVQQLLFRLGFRHGIWDSKSEMFTPTVARITPNLVSRAVELPPFAYFVRTKTPVRAELILPAWKQHHIKCAVRDDRLLMPVFLDVHLNLAEGLDLEDVWHTAREASFLGTSVRVQSATGMLWFIASRLYLEAFSYNTLKLSMFGDVHTLLTAAASEIDWAELVATAYKYGLRPALFYVLAQAKTLLGAEVPMNVLALLRPNANDVPLDNDFGDFIPKLLSRPLLHSFKYAS
jgi:hypothetical protein